MKKVVVLVGCLLPLVAHAGGYEYPANGTEALGRGGTFTAKADTALAMEYNVAGFARQRGTRLLLDLNLSLLDSTFQRAGNYPGDPTDPATPWAGQPFPKVAAFGGPTIAPFLGVSSDFNYFDRWTFAIGGFAPSSYGTRYYPTTVKVNGVDAPAPQRYDLVKANLVLFLPTVAAAVRVTKWLELGLALHVVIGHFDLGNVSTIDLGPNLCKTQEYAPCDATTNIQTTGATATFGFGAMFHPIKPLSIGLNLRGPIWLNTSGTVTATPPAVMSMLPIAPGDANFNTGLPLVLRLGVRYAFLAPDGFEKGDIELDGIYEAWSMVQQPGDHIQIPMLAFFTNVNPVVTHMYNDTGGIRIGGAYNHRINYAVLHFRAGFAFDSAATDSAYQRLDFATYMKFVPTVGFGFTIRGIAVNLAYAFIYEPDRVVTDGNVRVINGTNGTNMDASGALLPAVNNGSYHTALHVISVGINFKFDDVTKRQRVLKYD
jgi:long-subunit fatty acid transport protein